MEKDWKNNWSDWKKFWTDLIKSLLIFITVAFLTSLFLENYNSQLLYKRTYTIAKQEQLYKLVLDFNDAYQYYQGVAYDAKKEREILLRNQKDLIRKDKHPICGSPYVEFELTSKTKNISEFEGIAYWDYSKLIGMIPTLIDTDQNEPIKLAIKKSKVLSTEMYCKYILDASLDDFEHARLNFKTANDSLVLLLREEFKKEWDNLTK